MNYDTQCIPLPEWMEPARLRHRFAFAGWGLAVLATVGACTAVGAGVWTLTELSELWYVTAMFYVAIATILVRAAYGAIGRVRAVRKGVFDSATSLIAEAADGNDGSNFALRRRADDFEHWMIGSRSALGFRIFPYQAARTWASRVVRETETSGLTPESLAQIAAVSGVAIRERGNERRT